MTQKLDKDLVTQILESPNAPIILEKIKHTLEEEQKKREQFYKEITEQEKAEFINGEVIIHSPVKKSHNEISGNVYKILEAYTIEHQLGFVGIEKVLIKCTRNDYEPDVCFFGREKASKLKQEQMFFPVPDMIAEVLSKSTEHRDRGIKFEDYQNHGVKEYWIIDPVKKLVEQYQNKNGKYELIVKSNSGKLQSNSIDKLILPIEAIFDREKAHQFIKEIMQKQN